MPGKLRPVFRNVFVLDSRRWFASCRDRFDPGLDLVLTYDLALKREIETLGGAAFYVDHLLDAQEMQANNFLAYEFLRRWHFDAKGEDLFEYRDVPFGFALRIYFWSEYLFYVRARLCLDKLRAIRFDAVFAGTQLGMAESILSEMGITYSSVVPDAASSLPAYFFPIHDWMNEKISKKGIKSYVSSFLSSVMGSVLAWPDRFRTQNQLQPAVFVQLYHPTSSIIRRLKADAEVRVVGLAIAKTFWRTLRQSRYIPFWGGVDEFRHTAADMMRQYSERRCARLVLANGLDISDGAYAIIDKQIAGRLPECLRDLTCVTQYLDKNPIALEVIISNVGGLNGLIDSVCKARGVPSFLIINGWLGGEFLDEGKYATFINAYAPSIREHYFRSAENVVCLGDPRMDAYPPVSQPRAFDRNAFTVTIGASGYNNIDLNSYVAVEFDFMFDVLKALVQVKRRGVALRVLVKVRPNGYPAHYEHFTSEYFPGVVDEILDQTPMKEVLSRSDLYISIYSQTIFEASCLGISSIYYKKDTEIMDPPFDGKSELVTVDCVDDLVQAIEDFRCGSPRFDAFRERSTMEKYIGPLDGRNLERNLDFIRGLLSGRLSGTRARQLSCGA